MCNTADKVSCVRPPKIYLKPRRKNPTQKILTRKYNSKIQLEIQLEILTR